MIDVKFFKCVHCGNIVEMVQDSGVPLVCCGEKMKELTANMVDASTEKHVPVVNVEGNKVKVKVGEVTHPMTCLLYTSQAAHGDADVRTGEHRCVINAISHEGQLPLTGFLT